jgi:hypothetical protein
MPPKEGKSKKQVKAKQEKLIQDATFGLKNKNKSAKVQNYVNTVNKAVRNSNLGKEQQKVKEAKEKAKLQKKLEEEEERTLLSDGIPPGKMEKKKLDKDAIAASLGLESIDDDLAQQLEEMGVLDTDSDSDDEEEEEEETELVVELEEELNEAVGDEVFYERTIEDIIEEQRAALSAMGVKGTPVTEVSFQQWKRNKEIQKKRELEARVKAEQTKKKGGKGLSVLSGKELFNYDAALFKDDDAGGNIDDDEVIAAETKAREEREAKMRQAEEDRAQKEQDRLMEAARLEAEANKLRLEERKLRAFAPDAPTCELDGIAINMTVFDYEEMEDLLPFRTELGSVKTKLKPVKSEE